MKPFVVKKRVVTAPAATRLPWGVFERIQSGSSNDEERLVSAWATRDDAREAARQLNAEEPR